MSFVVAIDGPAGSGKGTVAKLISEKLGFVNIDTGATFRCIALAMIQKDIKKEEEDKIKELLNHIDINMKPDGTVLLNGEIVTDRIRENDVNTLVSPISVIKIVRDKLLDVQRKIAEGKNVVMEGRDIGTVVFPDADVKIYLDASEEERAKRRYKENIEKGINSTYQEVLENIRLRDENDKNKEIGALKKADDAIVIDTTNLTIEQVVEQVEEIIESKLKSEGVENV